MFIGWSMTYRVRHLLRRCLLQSAVILVACDGPTVDAEAVAQIIASMRASGAGPGVAPSDEFTLESRMAHWSVPGVSIAVVDSGRIIWSRGFGVKEVGTNDSVMPTTVFQAASLSKPLAATAMLRMVDQGHLDLDLPVYHYLRSWAVPQGRQTTEHPVTLRFIASHSAGFTVGGFPGYLASEPVPTVPQILNGEPPANTSPVRVDGLYPGEAFRYSGGGFTVMQLIMSDVAEEPFPSLMRRLVLDPVGMARSTYEQPLPLAWTDDAAVGHTSEGEIIRGRWRTYPEMAAAGLWTTPTDLLKWAMKITTARDGHSDFLSRELVEEMLTPTPQMKRMGLGVMLRGTGASFSFGHPGSNLGYRSGIVYFPATGQGAAVLMNRNCSAEFAAELFAALADVFAWPVSTAQTQPRRNPS